MEGIETDMHKDGAAKDAAVPSETALSSLLNFAQAAWQDTHQPLDDVVGPVSLRCEIQSTWMLLVCLYHAQAESERCLRAGWKPRPWVTEAQALRHLYLQSPTFRILCGLLRWLRWAHKLRSTSVGYDLDDDACLGNGSYDRTRRLLQQQSALPGLMQPALALHPDGPLQHPSMYDPLDLEDEEYLLRRVLVALRQGDLRGAMKLCAEGGQPWRTAFLQGMLPFSADDGDEVGYPTSAGVNEEMISTLKEQHTDWTEVGAVSHRGASDGNPWRRIWKEQCWDTVQRHLGKPSSPMSVTELGIYAFCAGRLDALLPACKSSWADTLWAELHCLKECLVERLLDAHRSECAEGYFLGEGDCGVPDPTEDEASRESRRAKLGGLLHSEAAVDVEAAAHVKLRETLRRFTAAQEGDADPATRFSALQAAVALAALDPREGGEEAFGILRHWMAQGLGPVGTADGTACPYCVREFASYFAIWQRDVAAGAVAMGAPASPGEGHSLGVEGSTSGAAASASAPHENVDDLIRERVGSVIHSLSGCWMEQGLDGNMILFIAEHVSAMTVEGRLAAWASLILQLEVGEPAADRETRIAVLKVCLTTFWNRFPRDFPRLLVELNHRTLQLHAVDEEDLPGLGPIGVNRGVQVGEVLLALDAAEVFWAVSRDCAEMNDQLLGQAADGLREFVYGPDAPPDSDIRDRIDLYRAFVHGLLEDVVLPVVTEAWVTLLARDPSSAFEVSERLQGSLLWTDAISSGCRGSGNLTDLAWFAQLCMLHTAWLECQSHEETARGKAPISRHVVGGFGAGPRENEPEREAPRLRDAVLDHARTRLEKDRRLLVFGTHSTLTEGQWQRLCSAVASRTLLMLLSVFECTGDLDGAMSDLVVAVARSPWMLSCVSPRHARVFLERLALVPTRSEDPRIRGGAAADAGAGATSAVMA